MLCINERKEKKTFLNKKTLKKNLKKYMKLEQFP